MYNIYSIRFYTFTVHWLVVHQAIMFDQVCSSQSSQRERITLTCCSWLVVDIPHSHPFRKHKTQCESQC